MEAIGFERRLQRFPWISYNSLVTVTFFIPYCLGKMAATFVVHQMEAWRQFERWIAVASCVQFLVVFLIPESPRWLLYHQRKYNSPLSSMKFDQFSFTGATGRIRCVPP